MSDSGFVHLHLHTHYSLLDGATEIKKLMARVCELNMPAVAITDHGNLFGAIEFYSAAAKSGIKPLIGMEAYLAPQRRQDRDSKCVGGDYSYHLLLLAKDLTGYRNLLKLSSIAYREGFYYKPRIDKDILQTYNEGLICTSTCLGAELPQLLLHRDEHLAAQAAEQYLQIFGTERFFIEVQDHGLEEQKRINPALFDLAQRLGLGVVATNDVHYLSHDDVEAHDVLCCISTGSRIDDEKRFKFPSDQFYLKSAEEMASLFPDHPEVLDNTLRLAQMCNVDLDFGQRYAPVYKLDKGKTDQQMLRELVIDGAHRKYGTLTPEIQERLDYELEVISSKGFCSYFLICWDLMNYARDHGIPCGARGSGCSSAVSYCLNISSFDPLRYGLYFERFMDPDRDEMPDIDIDMCQEGRQEVIDYVRSKYGHVAQIITFGTLKARAAVKDVSRVMGVDFERANRITQLIPAELNMTIDRALEIEPELRRLCDEDDLLGRVIDISKRIEGLSRHVGVHAAGVVIADQPLENFLPLYRPPGDNGGEEQLVTQYDGNTVERVGLLKMDFLGLQTLTILERASALVEHHHNIGIDLHALDLTDQRVYEIFARGDTKGVFQFESEGMRDVVRRMRPNRIEDLIAANALYRPGPMINIDAYIARKHGEQWSTPHPIMSEVLSETYGIMVYQEQVSRLVNRLGGIELKKAFRLAKAISKKKSGMIAAMRSEFISGCVENGVTSRTAEEIFEDILRFGGYAFNKAHSTGYALIAFQTAYMKAYHPVEFMAALLTCEMGSTSKIIEYIEECKRIGLPVKPPDINMSNFDFTPVYLKSDTAHPQQAQVAGQPDHGGHLRFGLGAIRGLGAKAVQAIVEARQQHGPFESIFDFCERVDLTVVNRGAIDALIKSGAFDCTGAMRKALIMVLGSALEAGQARQRDRQAGQLSLLDGLPQETQQPACYPTIPDDEQWTEAELLACEKEVLGFYITNHPLSQHEQFIRHFTSNDTMSLDNMPDGTEVVLGGMITKVRTVVTRKGRSAGSKMGIVTLEDTIGSIEAIIFPGDLERCRPLLALDSIVFLKGDVDQRRQQPSLRLKEVIPLSQAHEKLTKVVWINLLSSAHAPQVMTELHELMRRYPGDKPVMFRIQTADALLAAVRADRPFGVNACEAFCRDVQALLGEHSLEFEASGHGVRVA